MRFRTRAKTAYGLLSEIRQLILEEPKRYNQGDILNIKGVKRSLQSYADEAYPACGTIGCVAGWATSLMASHPAQITDPMGYAAKKLGLSGKQHDTLFRGDAVGPTGPLFSQTREHAERGAAHIAAFQQANAAQLKRTKI